MSRELEAAQRELRRLAVAVEGLEVIVQVLAHKVLGTPMSKSMVKRLKVQKDKKP